MNIKVAARIKASRQVTQPILHPLKLALMWVRYLQVPILASIIASALAFSAATGIGPASLVLGAYDGRPQQTIPVALMAILLCFVMWDISRVILKYGPDRFNLSEDEIRPGREWQRQTGMILLGFLFGSVPVLTLLACHRAAKIHWSGWVMWAVMFGVVWWCYLRLQRWSNAGIARLISRLDVLEEISVPGYRWKKGEQGIGYGHVRSALMLAICGIVAALLFFLPSGDVAAAIYVLLLIMGLAWVCSALGFFLWRHHVPLVLVLGLWVGIGGWFFHKDYGYRVMEVDAGKELPSAYEVLVGAPPLRRIAVAAVGGGIHSGAWEVEVLTRLQEISGCRDLPDRLCAISGTSGGSYGAMLYAHAMYHDKAVEDLKQEDTPDATKSLYLAALREAVRATSLGSVVRALAYRDLPGYFAPLWFGDDRGTAMEKQWTTNAKQPRQMGSTGTTVTIGREEDLASVTLAQWGQLALEGKMPAILFTSGTEESGRPVIYGSSKVWDWNWNATRGESARTSPRKSLTVPVVTGARLSASFPFVSPAARPAEPNGHLERVEHQMDGGYYDNYGLVALNRWLEEGLAKINEVREKGTSSEKSLWDPRFNRFLVIQIRYKAKPEATEVKKGGFFYQMSAPLTGLYQARVAGQRLRADEQFDVFTRYWKERGVTIDNVAFEFEEDGGAAPLSWHLTENQKGKLETEGKRIVSDYKKYVRLRNHWQRTKSEATSAKKKSDCDVALGNLKKALPLGVAACAVVDFITPEHHLAHTGN